MEENPLPEIHNCAFQYSTEMETFINRSALTMRDAEKLWSNFFYKFVKDTKSGVFPAMCIWQNMTNTSDYRDKAKYLGGGGFKVIDGKLYGLIER